MAEFTSATMARAGIFRQKKRYLRLAISILLAMTFSCAAPFFLDCMHSSQEELKIRWMGKQDYILLDVQDIDWEDFTDAAKIKGEPGFGHVIAYGWTEDQENRGTPIGWLDDRAAELYCPQLLEGNFPQSPDEIAIEEQALLQMGLPAKVGEPVTLMVRPQGDDQAIPKTYTLSGILGDKRPYVETSFTPDSRKLPAAFVCPQPPSQEEALLAFVEHFTMIKALENMPRILYTLSLRYTPNGFTDDLGFFGWITLLLSLSFALLSCFGIAGAFSATLKERQRQIGMLRAIGATKRQIFRLFFQEAACLALLCIPLSMALSYAAVWGFARLAGENFLFRPKLWVLAAGGLFGLLCVLLSALVPLISISRLSPMQAVRDPSGMRILMKRKIRSRKIFRPVQLLARRKILFSPWRQLLIGALMGTSVVVGCFGICAIGDARLQYRLVATQADYEISPRSYSLAPNHFWNLQNHPEFPTLSQAQAALALPGVQAVDGEKQCFVNLLMEEVPDYVALAEWDKIARRYLDPFWDSPPTREGLLTPGEETDEYREAKEKAGYDREAIGTILRAQSHARIEALRDNLIAGDIDLAALDAGTEILLVAPQTIGFAQKSHNGGYSRTVLDCTPGQEIRSSWDREMHRHIIATAERPFSVGDQLTLSLLTQDETGQIHREDRTVRIGGILSDGQPMDIWTTLQGLDTFGAELNYHRVYVTTQDMTPEADIRMTDALEGIFPGIYVNSRAAALQRVQAQSQITLLCLFVLTAVLCAVTVFLISSTVTAQIREDLRNLGTLRAVGAENRDLLKIYLLEILSPLLWGTVLGLLFFTLLYPVLYVDWSFAFWPAALLGPLVLLVCLLNLHAVIRKVSRRSIVDNIREL